MVPSSIARRVLEAPATTVGINLPDQHQPQTRTA
jgi:hypothetical protein